MTSPIDSYETNMGEQMIDLGASNRKFQTSIVVQQDPNKNGVLSFLKKMEETRPLPPQRQAPQTIRPLSDNGSSPTPSGGSSGGGSNSGGY